MALKMALKVALKVALKISLLKGLFKSSETIIKSPYRKYQIEQELA